MPEDPLDKPFTCPRCQLTAPSTREHLHTIEQRCAFCTENRQRILDGRPMLDTPNDLHPAGRLRS